MRASSRLPLPTTSALAAALASMALLGGCTPKPSPPPPPTAAAEPAPPMLSGCEPAKVPDGDFELLGDPRACKGGKLVMETNSYPTHLNYYGPERDANIARVYAEAMFNQLVSVHENTLEYVPELASSWEVEGGGKVLTFHLDPDAKWSDGQPVTAKDVLATYDLIESPDVVEVTLKVEMDRFERPVALDDRTVRFVAKQPSWRNLLIFDDIYIYPAHAIDPKTYLDKWKFEPPVVSGQYALGAHEAGKYFTFERRKDFWGEGKRQFVGTGNFDTLYYKVIFDNDIAFEYAKKGEIDFYLVTKAQRWAEETDFDKVQKGWIQKTKMYMREPQVPSQMAMNLTDPLFSDVRVRKALFWLYNREYLHDQLFYHQYVNKDSYWANSIYENPANEKVTFNPEKGLALLAEAGWTAKDADGVLKKDGRRFEFDFIYIHPDAERVYTPIQETYRKYGIKMDLKLIQPSAWVKVSQQKQFRMIYANWGSVPFPQPRDMWHSAMADRSDTANIVHFKDPQVDALIEAYELEPDLGKRAQIVQQMDGIIYAACPYLLDWYSDNFRLLWWDKFGMPEWISYATLDIRYTLWKTWWYEESRARRLDQAMKAGDSVPKSPPENRYWKDHAR